MLFMRESENIEILSTHQPTAALNVAAIYFGVAGGERRAEK